MSYVVLVKSAASWARNVFLVLGGFPNEYRKDVAAVLKGKFNSHFAHVASSARSPTESCWQPWKGRCSRSSQRWCQLLMPRSQRVSRRIPLLLGLHRLPRI